MLLESKAKTDSAPGKKQRSERLIFPRYHQLDCVRRLVRSAREEGPGTNYLVQHSAGSGKSNSIAWLAHRLAFLHDDQDKKVFNSVVVLTDRTVLDQQLQKRIADIEHVTGVVEKIEAGGVKSAKLAKALVSGVPIIVCTIHSFAFLHRQIASLPDRSYAVIVDEAHSSQSGEMSVKVKEALSEAEIAARLQQEIEDADDEATPDQVALRAAIARGKQDNLSFFAFTATPKYKTLHMFGHKGPDGRPAPFHLYSMKQAIEEQFILDVLRGYTTYDRFFELSKATPTDPDLDKRKAASALARFVNLHPTNVAAKTEVAVEHFRTVVKGRIGGKAKAMLVTGSRLQAVKYKLAFDKYIAEKGYSDIRCLVAFSGAVKDDDLPGSEPYTEVGMNQGIKERELPERFGSAEFQILLVADKYQTGFDQPLLHTMYVDKKLSGIQAVQTLSRLNRIHPDKTDTLVLDFFNKREHILASFKPFYTVTREDKDVDPQRLYELRDKLADAAIYLPDDIDGFADIFFKLKRDQAPTDHAGLNACLDCAVERYKVCDEEEQDAFRAALSAFRNLYGFLSQVVKFVDAELEKLYAFGRMLLRKLPRGEDDGPLDLSADVELMKLVVEKQEADDLLIDPADNPAVKGPSETGTGRGGGPVELLSEIIRLINERFGGDHDVEDLLRGVADQLAADEVVQQAARVNDKANFAVVFGPKLEDALVERHENHAVFIDKVYSDKEFRGALSALMLDAMYERLRAA
jgi:type I restriction enzyme R subunit